MSEVKLIAVTKPFIDGVNSAEELVAYCARVSNPGNQINNETAPKLLKYLAKHKHFSPFEMVNIVMEIKTTRDIGRQILRHRSFTYQEFSQRYAEVLDEFVYRDARLQDQKNRQNSISLDPNSKLHDAWRSMQFDVMNLCKNHYKNALNLGIAKEQARALLPEGLTPSTLYMNGSLRSWIHYCQLRRGNGTQSEHADIANKCWDIILEQFPSLSAILDDEQPAPVHVGVSAEEVRQIVNVAINDLKLSLGTTRYGQSGPLRDGPFSPFDQKIYFAQPATA